ncbi:hypothetical protein J7F01_25675 [Streptomyces sp. ISL-22]|uniref:hypothetical protein n=1 Tax=unclassified Streptomyces TaxID=2593676 RepID=UPI001BE781ED|nr:MULTISPECIES: hypothetical protein [unclassified Streptomyces]MBT2417173.1 hypothetical protein [Streptomyces sp. ISL-24]MBT2435502.1 hypothetical protein [Streptomyces sp. ISL-22]
MTAEHEGRDGRTGADALMAAITGEPLPDEARADAAFMNEHRAAVADVTLLREQLEIVGRALGEPPAPAPATAPAPEPEPVPVRGPSRVRRRGFSLAFGTLAVAAVASVVAGLGWLLSQAGDAGLSSRGSADQASSKQAEAGFGSPRYLACARLIAEGDVTAVLPVPGTGQERITLRVTRSYQPEKSEDEVTFLMEEAAVGKGEHILVGIPRRAAGPDFWAVGEQDIAPERDWITAALPEARKLTCA